MDVSKSVQSTQIDVVFGHIQIGTIATIKRDYVRTCNETTALNLFE